VLRLQRFRQRLLVWRQHLQYFGAHMSPRNRRVRFDGAEIRRTRANRAFIDRIGRYGGLERCASGHLAIAERLQLVLMPVHDRLHFVALLRCQIELRERQVDGAARPHGAATSHPAARPAWAPPSETASPGSGLRLGHRTGILCADADAGGRDDECCSENEPDASACGGHDVSSSPCVLVSIGLNAGDLAVDCR
jgi:hypothetical protein